MTYAKFSDFWTPFPLFTGLPAYRDTLGTKKTCHCNQVSLYPMIFSIRIFFFGPQNGRGIRGVTVIGA